MAAEEKPTAEQSWAQRNARRLALMVVARLTQHPDPRVRSAAIEEVNQAELELRRQEHP